MVALASAPSSSLILPATGDRTELGTNTFSVSCLFLGPLWFAWKRMFGVAVLTTGGVIITFLWGWFILPFIANPLHRRFLLRRGYVDAQTAPARPPPGTPLPGDASSHPQAARAMLAEIASIPVDTTACMSCGSREHVESRPFGFARVTNVDYGATAASAGISAVSMLLGGPGVIKGPKTSANIVRAQLVLCQECRRRRRNFLGIPTIKDADYSLHPWAAAAGRHGFTTRLDQYQLGRYKPTGSSGH